MVSLKQISLEAARTTLRLCLFSGIAFAAVWWVFLRSPETVKQSLQSNNAYSNFIDGVIAENQNQESDSGLPLNDIRVETLVKETFTPTVLQQNTEDFIDSAYAWLNGTTNTIEYETNVSEVRNDLADGFAAYAVNRLEFLPACNFQPVSLDPITTQCAPPNIDKERVYTAARLAIIQSDILPPDNIISTAKLPKDEQGKTLLQQYYYLPTLFQLGTVLPWVFLMLSAVAAFFVIRLQRFRRGLREVGMTLLGTCLGLAIFTYVFVFLLPDQPNQFPGAQTSGGATNQIQILSQNISNDLVRHVQTLIINISIQLAVVGVTILIAERYTRPASSYSGVKGRSGLTSSISPRKSIQLGKNVYDDVPIISSEGVQKKRLPKKHKKNNKARQILKGFE